MAAWHCVTLCDRPMMAVIAYSCMTYTLRSVNRARCGQHTCVALVSQPTWSGSLPQPGLLHPCTACFSLLGPASSWNVSGLFWQPISYSPARTATAAVRRTGVSNTLVHCEQQCLFYCLPVGLASKVCRCLTGENISEIS